MDRGTQIIYIPTHVEGDINHPDCETGFITSMKFAPGGDFAFCRYWNKNGGIKANSEATPLDLIVAQDTVSQEKVRAAFRQIESGFRNSQTL